MKLLLHICCAPCMIYPLEILRGKGYEVTGFFYNPNIHPLAEYQNRKEAVEKFSKGDNCDVIYPQYLPQEFFQAVNPALSATQSCNGIRKGGVNLKESAPERCAICWKLRLEATAKAAKVKGFKYFSTTLLVSPYQDQELLKKIGGDIAEEEGVDFYYQDFRPGFREAHNKAHAQGIYCQKYCGCIYSETERYSKLNPNVKAQMLK